MACNIATLTSRARCALAMDEEERLKAELGRTTKSERAGSLAGLDGPVCVCVCVGCCDDKSKE